MSTHSVCFCGEIKKLIASFCLTWSHVSSEEKKFETYVVLQLLEIYFCLVLLYSCRLKLYLVCF